MSRQKIRPLTPGYSYEIDRLNEQSWCQLLQGFQDGNIYQTPACARATGGRRKLSHFVLKRNGDAVAIALAKVKKFPLPGFGIASIYRGPLWLRAGAFADTEVFRQMARALRNEYVCKQRLALRLHPAILDDDALGLTSILEEEGFCLMGKEAHSSTILMDLEPDLAELQDALSPMWKRNLKTAGKHHLEIVEGTSDSLFEDFLGIYREMKDRKQFDAIDVEPYREMQAQLPEPLKMKILLGSSEAGLCAGLIYSQIGNTAIYLFGATSTIGLKSCGSYAMQWTVVQALKAQGTSIYNLNGINPVTNPGTYKFKSELAGRNGRNVSYVGRFDAVAGPFSRAFTNAVDRLRTRLREFRR